jgi:glycosyltransferase involved in cell wall biosynthesis
MAPSLEDGFASETERDFSVIICAFTAKRWDALVRAVASVRDQTLEPREIIVVIDGNEELQRRAGAELEGAIVTANVHGPGLCGGRQTGGERAQGAILAFLDDDAIADSDWLEQLGLAYADPNVLGAGGLVEPMWLGRTPRWLPAELNWVVGCTYAGLPQDAGRIRNPIGANMSMRSEVLRTTGSFEPQLSRTNRGTTVSGTCDETEFCIRASRRHPGGYWVFRPRARVLHAVPPERTTWRYFVRRCRVEGASKAILTGIAGQGDSLRSERAYARSVLPRAVARELGSALRGHYAGVLRAGAIVGGLLFTGVAYAEGRARARWPAPARA